MRHKALHQRLTNCGVPLATKNVRVHSGPPSCQDPWLHALDGLIQPQSCPDSEFVALGQAWPLDFCTERRLLWLARPGRRALARQAFSGRGRSPKPSSIAG